MRSTGRDGFLIEAFLVRVLQWFMEAYGSGRGPYTEGVRTHDGAFLPKQSYSLYKHQIQVERNEANGYKKIQD